MIRTFVNKETAAVFANQRVGRLPPEILQSARRKLAQLNRVKEVRELQVPPGNHLEKLSKERKGQLSIRINDQWRICFKFKDGDAYEVEIVDYH